MFPSTLYFLIGFDLQLWLFTTCYNQKHAIRIPFISRSDHLYIRYGDVEQDFLTLSWILHV